MSRDYPITLRLDGVNTLVVGGGYGTARRVQDLLAAGASVRLVCPEPVADVPPSGGAQFIWHQRGFQPADLDQVFLVVSCSGDISVADTVWQAAKKTGVLMNTVDDPARSNFVFPAIYRQRDLSLAVATGGKSPALAVAIRDTVAAQFGPEYGVLLDLLGELRGAVKAQLSGYRKRLALWQRLLKTDALALIRTGNILAARDALGAELRAANIAQFFDKRGL